MINGSELLSGDNAGSGGITVTKTGKLPVIHVIEGTEEYNEGNLSDWTYDSVKKRFIVSSENTLKKFERKPSCVRLQEPE